MVDFEVSDSWTKGKYIAFIDKGYWAVGGTTRLYEVRAIRNYDYLGSIHWSGAWRKYCFYTINDIQFDNKCLTEIAEFCKKISEEHLAPGRIKGEKKSKVTRRKNKLERLTNKRNCEIMDSISGNEHD